MTTQQERLQAAFDELYRQGVSPVLILEGSTGAIEDRFADYERDAYLLGTPGSWIGAHVGNADFGGGYWSDQGVLRYQHSGARVEGLYFTFPWTDNAATAATAIHVLTEHGFDVSWSGRDQDPIIVELTVRPAEFTEDD